jgi:hypothetical protein
MFERDVSKTLTRLLRNLARAVVNLETPKLRNARWDEAPTLATSLVELV